MEFPSAPPPPISPLRRDLESALTPVVRSVIHPMPPVIFHYTTPTGFAGILDNGEVWATHILFMNDAHEYQEALDTLRSIASDDWGKKQHPCDEPLLKELLARLDAIKNVEESTPLLFVSCFSTLDDNLGQWRAYGGDCGVSIGFDSRQLLDMLLPMGGLLVPCLYKKAAKEDLVRRSLAQIRKVVLTHYNPVPTFNFSEAIDQALDIVGVLAPMFKNQHFEGESEWRIVAMLRNSAPIRARPKSSILSEYIALGLHKRVDITWSNGVVVKNVPQLPIASVRIGPSEHARLTLLAANALLKRNSYSVRASPSSVPFRRGT